MKRSRSFYLQLLFTPLLMPLHRYPIVLSALAGVTKNYFIGISSGFTLEWLVQVWEMYSRQYLPITKNSDRLCHRHFIFRRSRNLCDVPFSRALNKFY